MILHIFHKGNSFTKHGIQCFESANIDSQYLVPPSEITNYTSSAPNVLSFPISSKEYYSLINSKLNNYKLILFHGLLGTNTQVFRDIIKIQNHPQTAWIIYGGELTEAALIPSKFLGPKTTMIYYRTGPYRIIFPIKRLLSRLSGHSIYTMLKKTNYAVHFMKEEIDVCNKQLRMNKAALWFTYVMLEEFIGKDFINQRVVKDGNILIGNSASFTSNHAEVFHMLKYVKLNNKKVIVPLNYGNASYKKYINSLGNKLLGDHFSPINELLSSSDYHNTLLSCSCMILNHHRQQALGNIITALWLGSKVYINDNISTYAFFKSHGITLFSLNNEFDPNKPDCFSALTEIETSQNREILKSIFSFSQVQLKIHDTFVGYAN